jgi:hypothetical protein
VSDFVINYSLLLQAPLLRYSATSSAMSSNASEPFDETRWEWLILHTFKETAGAEA